MADCKESWKISVIVPVYKVEDYLDECISSIVNQEYMNIEIILVNDGSPDHCPYICDAWAKRDSRIHVLHQSNGGLSDARNKGMEMATGEYITFVDSDDFIEPAMYRELMDAIIAYRADVAICGSVDHDENGHCRDVFCTKQPAIYDGEEVLKQMLIGMYFNEFAGTKLYKRTLFDGIRFPLGEINEDIVTINRVLSRSKRAVHIGEPLYHYRYNASGITQGEYNRNAAYLIKVAHMKEMEAFIRKFHPTLITELCIFQGRYACSVLIAMYRDLICKHQKPTKSHRAEYVYCQKCVLKAIPCFFKRSAFDSKCKAMALRYTLRRMADVFRTMVRFSRVRRSR